MDIAPEAEIREILEEAQCVLGRVSKSDPNSLLLGNPLEDLILTILVIRRRSIRQCSRIILGTNVISEPMKPNGNSAVQAWLDRQTAETLYLTATSLSKSLVGIEILPDGKRKEGPDTALRKLMEKLFESRILSFDQQAAIAYAPIASRARANGCLISVADGQIAAIAVTHGFTIATKILHLSLPPE